MNAKENNYFLSILGYAILLVVVAPSVLSHLVEWRLFDHPFENRILALALILAAYPAAQLVSSLFTTEALTKSASKSRSLRYATVTLLGYVILGFGFLHHALFLTILGRALCGWSSEPINRSFAGAQSANPLLTGLAFVIGPAFASLIADASVLSYFQSAIPFWLLAALALVQIVFVSRASFIATPQIKAGARAWLAWFYTSVKSTRRLAFFAFITAWYLFIHFFGVVLFERFSYSESKIGFVYALIGLCFVFAYLIRPLRKPILLLIMLSLSAVSFVIAEQLYYFVGCALLIAFLSALLFRQIDWFLDDDLFLPATTSMLTLVAIAIGFSILSLST